MPVLVYAKLMEGSDGKLYVNGYVSEKQLQQVWLSHPTIKDQPLARRCGHAKIGGANVNLHDLHNVLHYLGGGHEVMPPHGISGCRAEPAKP